MTGKNGNLVNNTNSVILVDSIISNNILQNYLSNNVKVISFDYESHNYLKKNNIQHEISDNYLTKEDREFVQEKSLMLLKWYELPEIKNLLQYENINVGQLFHMEFHYFLLPFLKKFFELIKICEKHKESQFIVTSDLYDIVKSLSRQTFLLNNQKKTSNSFLYDSVKFRLTDSLSVNISRKTYLNLKNISEKILIYVLRIKSDHTKLKKSILVVEFDPIRYESLFLLSKKESINFLLYNRRKPSIWNFRSYSIIKNSNCYVASTTRILNKDLKNKIKISQYLMKLKIDLFWDNEGALQSFFSLNEYSFWRIIKSHFKDLCTKRILEAIEEIEITKELFNTSEISAVLIWNENGFNEQIILGIAKTLKIKIILIQHGYYDDSHSSYSINQFLGVLPVKSDKFIVWGNVLSNYVSNTCNVSQKKIEILGSPIYDVLFHKSKKNKPLQNKFILLATTSNANMINDLLIKTKETYAETITTICNSITDAKKNLLIKIHPFEEEYYIINIAKKINPKIKIKKKTSIISLIESCEIFISIDASTTILESQILGKPTMSIRVTNDATESSMFISESCLQVSSKNFNKEFIRMLNDKSYRNKVINKGNNFVNKYFVNQGNASEKILSFFRELI